MSRRLLSALVLIPLTAAGCSRLDAPGGTVPEGLHAVEGLGTLSFPNSGNAAAQAPFLRGVLLLHSFEFDAAAESFRQAQEADPGFALAYWGEAMTYNHPLWQQQDREKALAALGRLGPTPADRAAKAPTDRERKYLGAIEILYGDGSKADRDQAYMTAMAALATTFSDDMEARAFYALAILGSRDGVRDFATYMRAAATAQQVFDRNPDHPGAAHYLIHSFDDPVHAPLGLPAATRYASIAPSAAHAQHMTSHIFVALGMWNDVVAANTRAMETQNADNAKRGRPANVCGHYSSWLQYGYLMRGEKAQAETLMDKCHARMSEKPTASEQAYFVNMRARQILDTEDWTLSSKWMWTVAPDASASTALRYAFTNAFAALRMGNPALAKELVSTAKPGDAVDRLHLDELRGLLAIAAKRTDEGIKILGAAADAEDAAPFEFGPPAVLKPTAELLGEELTKLGRADQAKLAFDRAMSRTPGRPLAAPRAR